jgi:hypothetical protein
MAQKRRARFGSVGGRPKINPAKSKVSRPWQFSPHKIAPMIIDFGLNPLTPPGV